MLFYLAHLEICQGSHETVNSTVVTLEALIFLKVGPLL